jgi:ribonucleoside-diphosphate reductase alpha chain
MLDSEQADAASTVFDQPIAEQIWRTKYQYISNGKEIDRSIGDTWRRVANSLSLAESPENREKIAQEFYDAMDDFKLLPAGRILAGSGTARDVTLSNTFVIRKITDSVAGIMDAVKDAALTMKMGGGIGFDFSTIRPQGTLVRGLDCLAAGPLAAMDICDAVCKMLVSGTGRGAMMATLRCDHPDIEAFITAKSDPNRMRNFNLSVLVSNRFMDAVKADDGWDLVWDQKPVRRVQARTIWHAIMRQAYEAAEPGVLFIDNINAANPLAYMENISATNSCAEQPLPPNGTCPLASINLARLVKHPFSKNAQLDLVEIRKLAGTAVRMLDNVIDLSLFAVDAQKTEAQAKRRIGVGVTGVADTLIMLGIHYGTPEARAAVEQWMQTIQNATYLASANLAATRGPFPSYKKDLHRSHGSVSALDPEVRSAIEKHGLRNGTLTTIAPTGTISMLAGNVSSGIEPVFALSYNRVVTNPDGSKGKGKIETYSVKKFREMFGDLAPLTAAFVTVQKLRTDDHIQVQAAAQRWVDSGISKTVNCPGSIPFSSFEDVYKTAFESGCKGCTTYRPNAITGSILSL